MPGWSGQLFLMNTQLLTSLLFSQTGEMEVKNPLFHDDPTPATPSIRKETEQDHEEDKSNK